MTDIFEYWLAAMSCVSEVGVKPGTCDAWFAHAHAQSDGPSKVSMTVMEGMKAGVNDYAVSCGAADWHVSVWVYGRATPRGVTTQHIYTEEALARERS